MPSGAPTQSGAAALRIRAKQLPLQSMVSSEHRIPTPQNGAIIRNSQPFVRFNSTIVLASRNISLDLKL